MSLQSQRAPKPRAKRAGAERAGAERASAVRAGAAWSEPTKSIKLRWGTYRYRYFASLVLILGGALIAQPTSVYSGYLFEIGISAQVIGWLLSPTNGPRRAAIVIPATICSCGLLIGSAGAILLVVPFLAWLLIRRRPPRSFLTVLLPCLSAGILTFLFPQYGAGVFVAAISLAVLVGSAWLARAIATTAPGRR